MRRQNIAKINVYIFIISLFFLMILALGMKEKENKQLYFTLESNMGAVKVLPFETESGACYVFLPSHADFSKMRVRIPAGKTVSLGECSVSDGMYCNDFQTNQTYALVTDGIWESDLVFLQSENIPSMYIDTASGNMNRVHSDKENEEEAAVRLYTQDGTLHFMDAGSMIKGRGNYTWSQEKKPYSLNLSYEADLLGMGSSSEWTLLANVADASNLNNKLVLDLANQFCREWTPECEFVDLYLNGEYAGLYLLTERLGPEREKLDLNLTDGEYLCRIDYPGRIEIIENPIVTQAERVAYVSEPKRLSEEEKSRIAEQVQSLENLILSGGDLTAVEWFDLDSWVRRYLIDEISVNLDSDMASSYFYRKNGTFYAGPVWDYDVCFGNRDRTRNPAAFYAKTLYKTELYKSLYYDALYNNPSFYAKLQTVYKDELLPLLEYQVKQGIDEQAKTVKASAEMDKIRWQPLYDATFSSERLSVMSPENVRDFLEKRVDFLNRAWIEGASYYTLEFKVVDSKVFSVPEGRPLETDDEIINAYTWVDVDTGEMFDPEQPVMRDMFLLVAQTPVPEGNVMMEQPMAEAEPVAAEAVEIEIAEQQEGSEGSVPERKEVSTRLVVMVASVILMFGMFVCLCVKDWKNQYRRKEYVHE